MNKLIMPTCLIMNKIRKWGDDISFTNTNTGSEGGLWLFHDGLGYQAHYLFDGQGIAFLRRGGVEEPRRGWFKVRGAWE